MRSQDWGGKNNIKRIYVQMFTELSLNSKTVGYFYFSLNILYFTFLYFCNKSVLLKKSKQTRKVPSKYDVKNLPLQFGQAERLKGPQLMSLLHLWNHSQAFREGWDGGGRPPTQRCDRHLRGSP